MSTEINEAYSVIWAEFGQELEAAYKKLCAADADIDSRRFHAQDFEKARKAWDEYVALRKSVYDVYDSVRRSFEELGMYVCEWSNEGVALEDGTRLTYPS